MNHAGAKKNFKIQLKRTDLWSDLTWSIILSVLTNTDSITDRSYNIDGLT